jgi:uncharacterized protein (TIGR00297 family)
LPLSRGEAGRKVVHIAVGSFALLLRWLTWREAALMAVAAFLFNWRILPRVGGRALWRPAPGAGGRDAGILLYPLAVLALVLVFRHDLWIAAVVWGILACGDGMATLAGQALGGPALPWNARKTWAGFVAFVIFGTAAAAGLYAWTLRLPAGALLAPWVLAASVLVALVCALVESLPWSVDDNVTVPLAGALVLAVLREVQAGRLAAAAEVPGFVTGFVLTAALAAAAWRARALDAKGAASTAVVGAAITAGVGWPGLAVMVTFFVVGSAATRLGYRRKAARGIAQERGGARGWRSVWANGAVPATLALGALAAAPGGRGRWVLAYAAAVATAAADTCSSEIGKAWGRRTIGVVTWRAVAPGTEGGVSLQGTLAGIAAAVLVGAVGAATGLYPLRLALVVAAAGVLGAMAESVAGGLVRTRSAVGNDLLNVLNTAVGAALGVLLGKIVF